MLEQKILTLKTQALEEIKKATTEKEGVDLKVKYLGRKSEFNEILKGLKDLSPEEKRKIGHLANTVKDEIINELEKTEKLIASKNFDWEKEKIDISVPGQKIKVGHLHILTQVRNEIEDIFTSLGFAIADGPEADTEFYNFDALNIPANHPARDKWDTFWLKSKDKEERVALRPHTSPVQIRYMEKNKPPFGIIVPGKCFRCEATDMKHEHTFYQFEALMVGEDINVGNFKYIGEQFFSKFFKKDIKVRLRPSFFPFTEPSFEFDISCTVCDGKGCRTCKNAGWLEIGGAGMVNQEVFVASGYKRNAYQGFAWGFGIERLAMMKYKIDDIRLFHSGDLRFVKQF
ncbi:phenylalanine--tRNA ligase subunit alpha [Patescibacteria group bacterium]|nr:phenylalanine--tRNA ligase subunit alpha [Patescibacteria group bacterium]